MAHSLKKQAVSNVLFEPWCQAGDCGELSLRVQPKQRRAPVSYSGFTSWIRRCNVRRALSMAVCWKSSNALNMAPLSSLSQPSQSASR